MTIPQILIVEDEPLLLRALALTLERERYGVFPTASPIQALEIVSNTHHQIDAVLSDIGLPEMQGTQLVREIMKISPQTVAVLMTGGAIKPAEVPPGVQVLKKPVSRADLLFAVNAALTLRGGKSQSCTLAGDSCATGGVRASIFAPSS